MTLLKTCCCCVSLRKGGIILGVLSLIGSLVGIVAESLALAGTFNDKVHAQLEDTFQAQPESILGLRLWLGLNLGLAVIVAICAILLIHGARKQRRHLIKPYLIADGLRGVAAAMYCVYQIYVAVNPPEVPKPEEKPEVAALVAFFSFVGLLIQFYLWLCVFSLFQSMREQSNEYERFESE